MKNSKGFTLVELLAVIVILSIIVIIAVPAVTSALQTAKKGAFQIEARKIINAAIEKRQESILLNEVKSVGADGYVCYTFDEIGISEGNLYSGTARYYPDDYSAEGLRDKWAIRLSDKSFITNGDINGGWLTMAQIDVASNIINNDSNVSASNDC